MRKNPSFIKSSYVESYALWNRAKLKSRGLFCCEKHILKRKRRFERDEKDLENHKVLRHLDGADNGRRGISDSTGTGKFKASGSDCHTLDVHIVGCIFDLLLHLFRQLDTAKER